MMALEHKKPEYMKINPNGQIPVLIDVDNTIVWDSHVIAGYLVDKYANNDSLYPKDFLKRTKINQMLFFEAGVLFLRYLQLAMPVFRLEVKEFSSTAIDGIIHSYSLLEDHLNDETDYLCGNDLIIADISIC